MKVLIISSSLSIDSRSFVLCNLVRERLREKSIDVDIVDARNLELAPCHEKSTKSMKELSIKIEKANSIIFGMGVHCYSINDSLKIILDNCCDKAKGKFFGILCAAGGERSYLSTMHLTQICMNEWRMIQLPRIVYATKKDFDEDNLVKSKDVLDRIKVFSNEFSEIGKKLTS